MARTLVHEDGRFLSSSLWFRVCMAIDLGVLVGILVWGVLASIQNTVDPRWFGGLAAFYALITFPVAVRSLGLWAGSMVWRRRLGLFAVLAVLWRGSPVYVTELQVIVVLYTSALWIVILLESKRVALAVAEATGEEVYRPDPTRRVD